MLKFLKLVQFIYMRWTVMEKQLDDEPGNSLKTFEKYVRWYHSVYFCFKLCTRNTSQTQYSSQMKVCTVMHLIFAQTSLTVCPLYLYRAAGQRSVGV